MTANAVHDFSSLLRSPGKITEDDVRHFRREVFSDGIVSRAEAEGVFAMNDSVPVKCEDWNEFFIEAMTDHVVHQAEPRGHVSLENAEWLVARISHDGLVDSASELEMLVKILSRASSSPEMLVRFALDQVAVAVLQGEGPLARGRHLVKGVIGEAEVELIRTILYAAGGAGGLSVSRMEAEILFDLNEMTDGARNHPAWQELFVRASANYLMAVSTPKAPSRAEALARQEWLEDTETDVGGFIGNMLGGFGKMFTDGFFDDVFTTSHVQMERAWKDRNTHLAARAEAANAIDTEEAIWLVERIRRDGKVNANEKALLEFIRQESHGIDPQLKALLAEAA